MQREEWTRWISISAGKTTFCIEHDVPGIVWIDDTSANCVARLLCSELCEYTTADVFVTDIVSVGPFVADVTITLEDEVQSLRMDDTATVTLESWNQD